MTLEAEVQALTQATTDLLQAVNVKKSTLDASTAAAEQAASTASTAATQATNAAALLGSTASVTATGTVTLQANSAAYQFIDPNGEPRDVILPTLTANDSGRPFCIKNTGTLTNALTVKTAAGTVVGFPILNTYALTVVWTGSAWEAV